MRGCRVRPCVLERTEAGLRLRHRLQHIEQVPRRSPLSGTKYGLKPSSIYQQS
jgi:hypothetical protein